jgi:hypothetical protein
MRYEDWPGRLLAVIDAAQVREFVWGEWDCGQFVGACVEAMTGNNPVTSLRATYTTETGMKRILTRDYDGSLMAFWSAQLGAPVRVTMAGRGDIVVVEHDGTQASGVVDLSGERVACLGLDGLEYLPITSAVAAWKVS